MLTGPENLTEYVQGGCKITCLVTGEKWQQNSYIVTHVSSGNTIVVDPGDNSDLIIRQIQDVGGKVTHILLTHPHHDHVGAAAAVSEHFNVACELHKHDVRLLMHAPMYALRFANRRIAAVARVQPFEELFTGAEEPVVQSIHTPGHTKGSVSYLFAGFMFTGDTLLYKLVGRTDLPGSSAEELSGSIAKLLNKLGDEITIFPGHGKPWSIGGARAWWRDSGEEPPAHNIFINELS